MRSKIEAVVQMQFLRSHRDKGIFFQDASAWSTLKVNVFSYKELEVAQVSFRHQSHPVQTRREFESSS